MNKHEHFGVFTEANNRYLVEAVNAAHAAYNVEEQFQERVISVNRIKYRRIILAGDFNAQKTTKQTPDNQTTPSTGNETQLAITSQEPKAYINKGTCEEDISDHDSRR